MRILKYKYEADLQRRTDAKKLRHPRKPAPKFPEKKMGDEGKRLFAQPVSGFLDANQPLSLEGMVWDKKRRVRDDSGRLKCDFHCADAASAFGGSSTPPRSGRAISRVAAAAGTWTAGGAAFGAIRAAPRPGRASGSRRGSAAPPRPASDVDRGRRRVWGDFGGLRRRRGRDGIGSGAERTSRVDRSAART